MGILTGLFKKNYSCIELSIKKTGKHQLADNEKVVCTDEMLQKVVREIKNSTKKSVIKIELKKQPVGLADSKFGGLPYLPRDKDVPRDEKGRQLRLLAQLQTSSFPKNQIGLPQEGLLQFWVLDNDLIGLETELLKMTSSKSHCVTFYEEIDDSVSEEEIKKKYCFYSKEESYFPIQDTYSLKFVEEEQGISLSDYQFEDVLVKNWNQVFPENKITSHFNLPTDAAEKIFQQCSYWDHKIGGYPMFTQADMREGGFEDYQVLLLQIDSVSSDEKEIMWGDTGIANFFIRMEDLRKRDFSNVLYTWDCY